MLDFNVLAVLNKLRDVSIKALRQEKYEKSLAACSAMTNILYEYNQEYVSEEVESILLEIKNKLTFKYNFKNTICKKVKTVLFYDGFGLDTRGLALIYLKGLVRNGYKVIYVTKSEAKGKQPEIKKATDSFDIRFYYIDIHNGYLNWIYELRNIFSNEKPEVAFFYTTPNDVSATIVFESLEGLVKRYQINLTDHAFWIGKYAFDYCVDMRDVGSKISYNYRAIPKDKIVMLPYYANVDENLKFEGFPFSTEGKRVIFSGGSLYKTLGDPENKYYKIVRSILTKYDDIIFLYAGYGDDSQLKLLEIDFPNRVYHIDERKDLYQVLKYCVLYLNTYPMFGGLMMNYSATAGKLPLTLKHGNDSDGLLFNQGNLGIEYNNVEEMLTDIDKLLTNNQYLKNKELALKDSVITI